MWNDIRNSQSIIVYNMMSDQDDKCIYRGRVGGMRDKLRELLSTATFYLLNDVEEYDVIAIV